LAIYELFIFFFFGNLKNKENLFFVIITKSKNKIIFKNDHTALIFYKKLILIKNILLDPKFSYPDENNEIKKRLVLKPFGFFIL
jgi:hypothetical protein